MLNSLIPLDFTPGIKASDINYNFNLLETWQKRERRRLGGYGIVEGFKLSSDVDNFTITIGKGTLITDEGDELIVDEKTFKVGPPDFSPKEEVLYCDDKGIITLSHRPYSSKKYGYITYIKDDENPIFPYKEEIRVEENETTSYVPILQISKNKIYVDPKKWLRHPLKVTYNYTENRVDSIFLSNNGIYKYEKSVISPSPSHVQMGDYGKEYMLGACLWEIEDKIKITFFDNHRLYRAFYVDEENNLWLNGKRYRNQSIIYFIKPLKPEPQDLWYDKDTNNLYIWEETDGQYGWKAINDHSTISSRDKIYFSKQENNFPSDNKTFLFPEKLLNLRFAPHQNSLQIIIDNIPIMQDQFEEIVSINPEGKNYLNQGIGFKLLEPLDNENSVVEVIVNHQIRSNPTLEVFQRAAIFVANNHIYYSNTNVNKVFQTEESYIVGEDQLEVYVDGKRLTPNLHYEELKDRNTPVTQDDIARRNVSSKYFKIKDNYQDLKNNSIITYKISKYVWSYDQLSLLIKDLERNIKENEEKINSLNEKVKELNSNVVQEIKNIKEQLTTLKAVIPNESNFYKKSEKINKDNLDYNLKSRLVSTMYFNKIMPTNNLEILKDAKNTDYIQIYRFHNINTTIKELLIPNSDYVLEPVDGGIKININNSLIDTNHSIYITGFKVGVD